MPHGVVRRPRARYRSTALPGRRPLAADPQTRLVRLAVPVDLAKAAEQIAQVRRKREAALDAENLDSAAALRDRQRQLLADEHRLERQ